MNQKFEREVKIKFWYNMTDELEKLSFEEIEYLEQQAMSRIVEMIKDGYTSGELCESIDENEFYGWWEYKMTTI
ncbi:hypothetical protein D0T60_01855 [Bacteroides sp. 224]|nr:hypothetical protein [Bacteroides sp. 224]